jgi:maleate isomerase
VNLQNRTLAGSGAKPMAGKRDKPPAFGWRARIGYLCPSVFELIAHDFYRIAPPGVGLIGVTCMIEGWSAGAYEKGLAQIERCATELGRRRCDFIIHSGVPLVVTREPGFEKELVRQIEATSGTQATTSIIAAMTALRELGIRRVGLVNPYPGDLNASLISFLQAYGFEVASVISLGVNFTRIGDLKPADIYAAARKSVVKAGSVEGLYFPCPQFPVLDVVEQIEQDLGVPAVSHLGAEMYAALQAVGVRAPIQGFGRLLRKIGG